MIDEKPRGLSQDQVAARQARGQGNDSGFETGRTYLQILRKNAFTFINSVLFGIGLVLVALGQLGDALVTAGLVLMNVIVGVYQEARAKRKLERIALLTRPTATVVRDGREQEVDPADVVLDDVLLVRPGDQVVVDGNVLQGDMEIDESLLTGESERVTKGVGDPVYSGSFCVTGSAYYQAEKVGGDSLINQMTAGARRFRQTRTPLQRDVDFVIRLLVLLVAPLGILLAISFAINAVPLVEGVRVAAVIVALVPQGLFFMTTVAYAMGAVRVAGRGALIQESNALESISHVDLLCLDKTGTLTSNRISLGTVYPLGDAQKDGESGLRRMLGNYAASTLAGNRTTLAILEACEGEARPVLHQVPFSSERKWSALAFDEPVSGGTYYLGAPEILRPHLVPDLELGTTVEAWANEGQRVLVFAHSPAEPFDSSGAPALPDGLAPLALLGFWEELRPQAQETLEHLTVLGIQFKILSGDSPQTVAALARQVGVAQSERTASGLDLGALDGELPDWAAEASIFGRITPQQKETLVRHYRGLGYYVAMIGDGVNDVLCLKQAQVGVAMQSGSQATRSVADLVLLNDSFSALPVAFREGQRIVRGMEDVIRLLLTRTFYVLMLVVATRLIGVPFPVTPKHNSILALLTVGIPILALAAWARPGTPPRSVIRSTQGFVFPASLTIAVVGLAVYLSYLAFDGDVEVARTALTTISVFCGLLLIPFVEPPTPALVGGDELSGDWRPSLLAVGMLGLYALTIAVPAVRGFFELVPLGGVDYLLLGLLAALWAVGLRLVWRWHLLERLLASPVS
jgi:cation-transporting ATPase E